MKRHLQRDCAQTRKKINWLSWRCELLPKILGIWVCVHAHVCTHPLAKITINDTLASKKEFGCFPPFSMLWNSEYGIIRFCS